jgi:ABC-type antimicrobial peptide transport system permease subunit
MAPRISLLIGFSAMITAVLIGTAIGLLSGFFGGWVDAVLMRITEIVMALPTVLLAIALRVVLPDYSPTLPLLGALDPNLYKILVAIGLVTWTGIARAVRGQVFSLKEREFIEAARALGCSNWRILTVHLLPNVAPTVIVLATLATAHNILLEAGLSFLGLGVDPSIPSWGTMIADGQPFFLSAPWILLAPGVAIVLAVGRIQLCRPGDAGNAGAGAVEFCGNRELAQRLERRVSTHMASLRGVTRMPCPSGVRRTSLQPDTSAGNSHLAWCGELLAQSVDILRFTLFFGHRRARLHAGNDGVFPLVSASTAPVRRKRDGDGAVRSTRFEYRARSGIAAFLCSYSARL